MKKIGFIILAVVLALGAIGAGYAAWSQSLAFNGTVASGTFVTDLVNVAAVADTHGVATLAVSGAGPLKSVTVTAANLYPNASEKVTFAIKNSGSVPATVGTVALANVPTWDSVTSDISTQITTAIAPGATSAVVTLTISMPETTTNQNIAPVSFTFTVPTTQQY